MFGMADKGHLPGALKHLLSPGYMIGLRAIEHDNGSWNAFELSVMTALSVNLIFWASILFRILTLWAGSKESN
jgi:hypothetical protein